MDTGPNLTTARLDTGGVTGAAGTRRAAELLRSGATVAFPTETVYGLGANALSPDAVARIFIAKGRPAWDPLIVHIEGRAMLDQVADLTGDLSASVEKLIAAFWPGPLTLLLPRRSAVPDAVTAGRPLLGVRQPRHPIARELIRLAQAPIAAPSANRFGGISPTTAAHVLADLDGRIDAVLDGGPASVGLESTVFDLTARAIYRPGAITAEMLAGIIGATVTATAPVSAAESSPSPGMGERHYAPRAKLILIEGPPALHAEIAKHPAADVGVMLPDGWDPGHAIAVFRWGPWENPETLARLLYLGLRMLDQRGVKVIVCPIPAPGGVGDALRDRLTRAAK